MSEPVPESFPARGLAIVGAVAQRLNSGAPQEETVAAVAETLRTQLPAEAVALWVHEPNATTFVRIGSGGGMGGSARVPRLDQLPTMAPGAERLALVHDSETLGVLEVHGAAPEAGVRAARGGPRAFPIPRRRRAVGGPRVRGGVAVA